MNSGPPYSITMLILAAWSANSGGPMVQPSRQPLIACDFDRLFTTTVRAAMPGSDASVNGTRRPGK